MSARWRPRRPYWTLAAFVVLILVPHSWWLVALAGAALAAAGAGIFIAAPRRAAENQAERTVVLGADRTGRAVSLSDEQLSAHGLILGASGAGKSTTLLRILTDQVRRGRPVVAIDMKGSPAFAREVAAAAGAAGRSFALWTPDGPSTWNPLQHGNATERKDKLIATERFTEPHYRRAAERYVQAALQVLGETHPARSPTLEEVVQLMDPARLSSAIRGLATPLADRIRGYLANLTADQLSAIRGLGTRLAIITESHSGAFLTHAPGRGGIDLRAALDGAEVVLFSLNSSRYGQMAAQLGTLVVQDLVCAVGDRLEGDARSQQAIVGIDEFSALGADHVIALLARGREAGVGTILATQEMADLDRAARGLREQVLGNTAVKIVHRQDVPSSAQTIAEIAGTKRAAEDTRRLGGWLLGSYETGHGTRREVERFLVEPNEIKTLRTGEAVLVTKTPAARVRTVHVAPPTRSEAKRDGPALA